MLLKKLHKSHLGKFSKGTYIGIRRYGNFSGWRLTSSTITIHKIRLYYYFNMSVEKLFYNSLLDRIFVDDRKRYVATLSVVTMDIDSKHFFSRTAIYLVNSN